MAIPDVSERSINDLIAASDLSMFMTGSTLFADTGDMAG